jgi:hypothetical protein
MRLNQGKTAQPQKDNGMSKHVRLPFTQIHIGRFLFLLISILLMFILRPFLEGFIGIAFLMELFFLFIFLSAVYAASQKKSTFIVAAVMVLLTEVLRCLNYFTGISSIGIAGNILGCLLFIYTAAIILAYLFSENNITADMIIGAICVYFLLGLIWAFVFSTLESLQPGSLRMPQGTVTQATFTYYSYTTLTTLGYGDVTPISSPARYLAILEAMIGQLYIAVLVARLVGVHIAQARSE